MQFDADKDIKPIIFGIGRFNWGVSYRRILSIRTGLDAQLTERDRRMHKACICAVLALMPQSNLEGQARDDELQYWTRTDSTRNFIMTIISY